MSIMWSSANLGLQCTTMKDSNMERSYLHVHDTRSNSTGPLTLRRCRSPRLVQFLWQSSLSAVSVCRPSTLQQASSAHRRGRKWPTCTASKHSELDRGSPRTASAFLDRTSSWGQSVSPRFPCGRHWGRIGCQNCQKLCNFFYHAALEESSLLSIKEMFSM